MPSLTNYGQAIASTTIAVKGLLASTPIDLQVTARSLDTARRGLGGASVNLFLYREELASYREGSAPRGSGRLVAELDYLVSAYAGDDADTDAVSQRAYGSARAAIERHPVISVPVGSTDGMPVRLSSVPLSTRDLTALWLASAAPLRLAFGVRATFTLDASVRTAIVGTVRDVVTLAGAGFIAVFSGTDAVAKAAAAASVARDLGRPLITVSLAEIVSSHVVDTERHLARLFDRAERGAAVLLIDETDSLFGPHGAGPEHPEVEAGRVLDHLARAPGVVIVSLHGAVGAALADRAGVEVRFPDIG